MQVVSSLGVASPFSYFTCCSVTIHAILVETLVRNSRRTDTRLYLFRILLMNKHLPKQCVWYLFGKYQQYGNNFRRIHWITLLATNIACAWKPFRNLRFNIKSCCSKLDWTRFYFCLGSIHLNEWKQVLRCPYRFLNIYSMASLQELCIFIWNFAWIIESSSLSPGQEITSPRCLIWQCSSQP